MAWGRRCAAGGIDIDSVSETVSKVVRERRASIEKAQKEIWENKQGDVQLDRFERT